MAFICDSMQIQSNAKYEVTAFDNVKFLLRTVDRSQNSFGKNRFKTFGSDE